MTDQPHTRRRWFQFRLRTLLAAVLVLSVPLSWFAWNMERARRQREAVSSLVAKGVFVAYESDATWEYGPPVNPRLYKLVVWYQNLLGKDFANPVVEVVPSCEEPGLTDADLVQIASLDQLRYLDLFESRVTDAGLARLHGLTELEHLDLRGTEVSPEGVENLQRALPNCKIGY